MTAPVKFLLVTNDRRQACAGWFPHGRPPAWIRVATEVADLEGLPVPCRALRWFYASAPVAENYFCRRIDAEFAAGNLIGLTGDDWHKLHAAIARDCAVEPGEVAA